MPSTVTCEVAVLMPPALARLSRATTWNVIVLVMAGSSSPVRKPPVVDGGTFALFRMCVNAGNVLVPTDVGRKGRKIGRAIPSESVLGTAFVEVPKSYSCQSYVSVSPFGSVAVAKSENGVCLGILKFPGPVTVGGVLPDAVVTAQVLPLPVWLYATITSRLFT